MDGMLSQDEINALLQGMDLSDTADGGDAAADPAPENSTAENYNRWPISVWDPLPQPYIHW